MSKQKLIRAIEQNDAPLVATLVATLDKRLLQEYLVPAELQENLTDPLLQVNISFLHLAAYYGNISIVEQLVEHGVDIFSCVNYQPGYALLDQLPRHYAFTRRHEDVACYLLQQEGERKSVIFEENLNSNHEQSKATSQNIQKQEHKISQLQGIENSLMPKLREQIDEINSVQSGELDDMFGGADEDLVASLQLAVNTLQDQLKKIQDDIISSTQSQEEMQNELKILHSNQAGLEEENKRQANINQLSKQPIISYFFNTFRLKLQRLVDAYGKLSTGLFTPDHGWYDTLGLTISIGIGGAPFPGAGAVAAAASAGVMMAADAEQKKTISKILLILNYSHSQMERIIDNAAVKLTKNYALQIQQLTENSANHLAQAAVWRIIECLRDGLLINTDIDTMEDEFIRAVDELVPTAVREKGSIQLERQTPLGNHWTDAGIFQETGILYNEKYYANEKSKIWLYDFRQGNDQDANRLNMHQVTEAELSVLRQIPTASSEKKLFSQYKKPGNFFPRSNLGNIKPENAAAPHKECIIL